ncbi:MAG: 3-dehydroquinate synthase [Bradyrhizobium sp.]|nr:3-dehydroquinate synthase [Bradyrhizobium sp.]
MPSSFDVVAASGSYGVTVGHDLVDSVVDQHPNAVFIIDSKLTAALPARASARIVVEAEEQNKSLEYMPTVISELRRINTKRDSYIVAVGGGIIQDIATFCASIYMRGLPWTYLATTVLAMVDSCIGGKSSINVQSYKNLVGNFYPPENVIIDTRFISTLNREMVIGGLYEAAKICYARGYDEFEQYVALNPGYPLAPDIAELIILRSLLNKKWFIEVDEFDRKERLLLNFGHTFGHAVEAATNFGVSHGIAVGLGMLVAGHFAFDNGRLSTAGAARVLRLMDHVRSTLVTTAEPIIVSPPPINLATILTKFEYDKKHRLDAYRVVLPENDGSLSLVGVERNPATTLAIRKAYERTFAELGWAYD